MRLLTTGFDNFLLSEEQGYAGEQGGPITVAGSHFAGERALQVDSPSQWVEFGLDGALNTSYYVRVYVQRSDLPPFGRYDDVLVVYAGDVRICTVRINPTGFPAEVRDSTNAVILVDLVPADFTYHMVELRVLVKTVGSDEVELRVDGTTVGTGLCNLGSVAPSSIRLGQDSDSHHGLVLVDELAVNDSTGSSDNSWPDEIPFPSTGTSSTDLLQVGLIRFGPVWRYLLATTREWEVIGELRRATNKSFDVDLDKPGSAACNAPIDPLSLLAVPWETSLIVQRDDDWVWSGPIRSRQWNLADGKCGLNAVGWLDNLTRRQVLQQVVYTSMDAGNIIMALLALANAQQDTHISAGTVQPSQPRTRTYAIDANIGNEVYALTQLESGCDLGVDPTTRRLDIFTRLGEDRPDCKWLFIANPKNPMSNCQNVQVNEDGDTLVNEMRARGKFATGFADDINSKFRYGLHMESQSLSDVVDTNILVAFANAEIVYRKDPSITYTITPKASVGEVPRFKQDFDLGDTTYLTARRDVFEVEDQAVRVFGATISIDDSSGADHVTRLQTRA